MATTQLRAGIFAGARSLSPTRLALIGTVLLVPLIIMAAVDTAGQATLWENAHWTIAAALAAVVAGLGSAQTSGQTRHIRQLATLGFAMYAVGQILWDIQVAAGLFPVPSPSDLFYLGAGIPIGLAVLWEAWGSQSRGERTALALDAATVLLAVAAAVLFVYEPRTSGTTAAFGLVLLVYPIVFIGLAAFTIFAAVGSASRNNVMGPIALAGGLALVGLNWAIWIDSAANGASPLPGDVVNAGATIGILLAAAGSSRLELGSRPCMHLRRTVVQSVMPVLAVIFAAVLLMLHRAAEIGPQWHLLDIAAWGVIGIAVIRQTLLLRERTTFAASQAEATVREMGLRAEAQRALAAESASEQRYRHVVSVFARLGEQLAFAGDEHQLLSAAAGAMRALHEDAAGEMQLMSSSRDRLVVELSWGSDVRPTGTVLGIDSPLSCIGIRRSGPYLVEDAAEMFSVTCPAMPATSGSVLCLPMVSHGQPLGVIHLRRTDRLTDDEAAHALRVAEQLALALANTRLLRTMEQQALTDPLTGLYNARFFDPFLERELAVAEREGRSLGVVMIDIDQFKDFNDSFGHPAGDEALRTFASAASAAIRRSDTLARYGGEEFILLVRDGDLAIAEAVAEKVRLAAESLVVGIGGGRFGKLSASLGVAVTTIHGFDRRTLVKSADRALYQAKANGRNRVVTGPPTG